MGDLPYGVYIQNQSVEINDCGSRDYALTLSILSTSLSGGLICDSNVAGCLLACKFNVYCIRKLSYIPS